MCGIAGFRGPGGNAEETMATLKRMAAALRHRGPDSHGFWHAATGSAGGMLGFAHTRLAIVDLSPAGHQPMLSDDGRYCVTYNGEIYNFMALRGALDAEGKTPAGGWRGHCDTEVLLAAVAAWGLERALASFVGMFAFALWDQREQSLTLVRDRLGIKPLYCGYCEGHFLFASELKALQQHPAWKGELDTDALGRFLRLSYVPAPFSIFRGIYKMLPGSYLVLREQDFTARRIPRATRYWSVAQTVVQGRRAPLRGDIDDLADQLEERLREAVRLRLVADVPLGAFLSGGVDSSTVTALMQELSGQPVRTFSIGSHSKDYDEAAVAREVAARLGTQHTELVVEPGQALEAARLMPTLYDEPYADPSQVPTYLVSWLARQHVTVCLSGDGGDELFAGYNRHIVGPSLWRRLRILPRPARELLAACLRGPGEALLARGHALLTFLGGAKAQPLLREKLQKIVEAMSAGGREDFFNELIATWHREEDLLLEPPAGLDPAHEALAPKESLPRDMDFTSWMMAQDQSGYLPDDILAKLDRASMAVALEGRVPLLDHRVVELAWRMPPWARISGQKGKRVLRRVVYRRVPRELLERPKQGFDLPLDHWLRGELRPWAEALLAPSSLEAGGVRPEPVRAAWNEHSSGRRNRHWELWTVLMYQAWREEYQGTGAVVSG